MQNKRKIKRYILAVFRLILAAYATMFIKDSVDAVNPEKSLPIISVSAGYNPPYVIRAGYTWHFGVNTVRSPYLYAADVPLLVTDCLPGDSIVINFSAPCQYVNTYMTTGLANDDFSQVFNMVTPEEEGIYVYKIEANFEKGDILYYFAVQVKQRNLLP